MSDLKIVWNPLLILFKKEISKNVVFLIEIKTRIVFWNSWVVKTKIKMLRAAGVTGKHIIVVGCYHDIYDEVIDLILQLATVYEVTGYHNRETRLISRSRIKKYAKSVFSNKEGFQQDLNYVSNPYTYIPSPPKVTAKDLKRYVDHMRGE